MEYLSKPFDPKSKKHITSLGLVAFVLFSIPATVFLAQNTKNLVSSSQAASKYVYWVHKTGTFESSCCGTNNPSAPTFETSRLFTLRNTPNLKGYEGVVCSPDCSSSGRVIWKGPVTFSPNTVGGTLILTPSGQKDTVLPTVSLTSPVAGSELKSTVLLSATAGDNKGVASVEFVLDNYLVIGKDTSAPYAVNWVSTQVANGPHTLLARAYDTSGNLTATTPIGIFINNPQYVYWVHITNLFETSCCGLNNPTKPSSQTTNTFTLQTSPDPRGYQGVVCSPDCGSTGRVVWTGKVGFSPNTPGGKLVLTPNGSLDLSQPTKPGNLTTALTGLLNQVVLKWSPSTDDVGVVSYSIWRNNVIIAKIATPYYYDTVPLAGIYTYQVQANDQSGKSSEKSDPSSVQVSVVVPPPAGI